MLQEYSNKLWDAKQDNLQFDLKSFGVESFLISDGLTWRSGFTLTEGLKEEVAPVPDNGLSLDEDGNFGVSFGVLGPGDLMGTTVERCCCCWEESSSGSGRRLGVG